MLMAAPLSIMFSVFEYFLATLEILSWINKFYFLNVKYPNNVEALFGKCDWSSFINIPTYSELNQPGCDYYFQSPEKFMNKGVDPLFINNAQMPLIFILLSVSFYLLIVIIQGIAQFFDKILTKEVNPRSANPFQLFKLQSIKQHTIEKTVQTVQNNQVDSTTETFIIVKNARIVRILNKLDKSLKIRVKSTISLSLLDISQAIILQLLFATEFQFKTIYINELLACIACLFVYYHFYQQSRTINISPKLANCPKFKQIYGSFYEGLNVEKQFGYIYNFIYIIRKILYIFFTVAFYYNPLLQTSLCFTTFVTGVILLLYQNPYESKKQYIQQLLSESSVSGVLLITILFAFNDQTKKFGSETLNILGWIIIALILVSLISEVLTLIYEILISLYQVLIAMKEWTKKTATGVKGQANLPSKPDRKQEMPIQQNPDQRRPKFNPSNGRLHQAAGMVKQWK